MMTRSHPSMLHPALLSASASPVWSTCGRTISVFVSYGPLSSIQLNRFRLQMYFETSPVGSFLTKIDSCVGRPVMCSGGWKMV
jgi:hypothetical protein